MLLLKKALKYIVDRMYKPLLSRWLSKKRIYRTRGITLVIPKGIFHPGFFFSTQFLLEYIDKLDLKGKKLLELGAGSGLIAIFAAKRDAHVTASDINPLAIEFLKKNSEINKVSLSIIQSDLFKEIPGESFDIIAINPPYYKKNPQTIFEHAWYCGENGEYFQKLFNELRGYIHNNSEVLMVISEDCDFGMIERMAAERNFSLQKMNTKKVIWEYLYIYKVTVHQ